MPVVLAIDRTTADPPPPPSRAVALQRGIWEASRTLAGIEPEDYDAARTAGIESAQYLDAEGDVRGFTESLLRAASSLRRDGRVVNTAAILTRVAAGRTFGAEARHVERNEAVDQVLDERAAAAGLVLDARLRAWGRRACSAVVSFEPELVLRVPLAAKLIVQARRIDHELGHIAADFDGVPRPHDEDWIDHVGAAIWLRRRGVRRALARWGWDGPRLLRAFGPEVPAEVVFRRVALVGGGLAILRSFEMSRRVFAPEHIRVHDRARGWEQRWMRTAMYGGEQHGFEGEGAWPFYDELEGRADPGAPVGARCRGGAAGDRVTLECHPKVLTL